MVKAITGYHEAYDRTMHGVVCKAVDAPHSHGRFLYAASYDSLRLDDGDDITIWWETQKHLVTGNNGKI